MKKFLDIESIDVIWEYIKKYCVKKEDIVRDTPISNDDIDYICKSYLYNS